MRKTILWIPCWLLLTNRWNSMSSMCFFISSTKTNNVLNSYSWFLPEKIFLEEFNRVQFSLNRYQLRAKLCTLPDEKSHGGKTIWMRHRCKNWSFLMWENQSSPLSGGLLPPPPPQCISNCCWSFYYTCTPRLGTTDVAWKKNVKRSCEDVSNCPPGY